MSRIPQAQSTRTPTRQTERARFGAQSTSGTHMRGSSPSKPSVSTPSKPVSSVTSRSAATSTPKSGMHTSGTRTQPIKTTGSGSRAPPSTDEKGPTKPSLSIKEAIALKRAEAKKVSAARNSLLDSFADLEHALPPTQTAQTETIADELGRRTLKEEIQRARSTGTLNISARSLPCLPSSLFEVHLGVQPERLEGILEPSTDDGSISKGQDRSNGPSWYDAQDLQTLKAWDNEISKIQPEISLFGSLKTVELHRNQIVSLPDSFADLSCLTHLNLSQNCLEQLPTDMFTLPNLLNLDVSHNSLSSLAFSAPFVGSNKRSQDGIGGGFFAPVVTRADTPLPRLQILNVAHNKFTTASMDVESLPRALKRVDFSGNCLGECSLLLTALGKLHYLSYCSLASCQIGDESVTRGLLSSASFPKLGLLNLGDNQVTQSVVSDALSELQREVRFVQGEQDALQDVLAVIVGKIVIREAWEMESGARQTSRSSRSGAHGEEALPSTEKQRVAKKEHIKEAWELEAEQGLLTEGGRRRARAAAARAAHGTESSNDRNSDENAGPEHADEQAPSNVTSDWSNTQLWARSTQTLELPSALPVRKGFSRGNISVPEGDGHSVPTITLPVTTIASQAFARTLRVLILNNRRRDVRLDLPFDCHAIEAHAELFPALEELSLEGCNLGDTIAVSDCFASGGPAEGQAWSSYPTLDVLPKLFPSLKTLNLAYNRMSSASLNPDILATLFCKTPEDDSAATPRRRGLRYLNLRGNQIADLDSFAVLADKFKNGDDPQGWTLQELDVQENNVSTLAPALGYLPLKVLLVEGNTFRIPPRRIWEREGTEGLLKWLRGRGE